MSRSGSDLGGSHSWLLDVGGGIDREEVASARPARFARPTDHDLKHALEADVLERHSLSGTVERVRLRKQGAELHCVLKLGGFWRSDVEHQLYRDVLDPQVHGSPALLAAGEGWLLLEEIADARPVDVDDPEAIRLVYRRLAGVHAAPLRSLVPLGEGQGEGANPLGASSLDPLLQLVDRAARDPQAWEITPAIQSLVASLAARPALPTTAGPSLLHGDYQRGNWLIDASGAARVLDWELSTVGPGILDLYYLHLRAPGAGHAPAGPMAERAVAWYHERLLELGRQPVPLPDLLAQLPDAIARGALAAAHLRLEDYYAETPHSRSPRGELTRAAADLIRYAHAQVSPSPSGRG